MNKSTEKKGAFVNYFDRYSEWCLPDEDFPTMPTTIQMGICKLVFNEDTNIMDVYLRRPGLLIGKSGRLIDKVKRELGIGIKIIEVDLIYKSLDIDYHEEMNKLNLGITDAICKLQNNINSLESSFCEESKKLHMLNKVSENRTNIIIGMLIPVLYYIFTRILYTMTF